MDINKIVEDLLTEEIGHFLCDSGGAYGYQYERNRENGILKGLNPVEEYTDDETQERTLEVTIPVYDFLVYNLIKDETTEGMEKQLFKELKLADINPYEIWCVEDFLNKGKFKGMHFDNKIEWVNTYNYEEFLSQTLQYALMSNGYDWFVLLEVHNGCDVRSGYTFPQLFKVKDVDYFLTGQYDRLTECECDLNSYTILGVDEIMDSDGEVSKEDIYNRTFVDDDGNVRCVECNDVVKGGFLKW